MKAIVREKYCDPEDLQFRTVDEPALGDDDVLVQVVAAGVDQGVWHLVTGLPRSIRLAGFGVLKPKNQVPGMDVAGVVTELGDGVEHLAVGDLAMGVVVPFGPHGGYREDKVLPGDSVVRVPRGTDAVHASTLPMNGLTARLALDLMGLRAGEVLAVTGAAGAFGGYVVQLARADGLTVVADASEADEELVRSLGADVVVRRGDDVAARIRELYPDGVDGLADGAVQNELVLPAVKDGGAMATVRGYKGDGERGVRGLPCQVARAAEDREGLDRLRQQAEDGVVTLRVAREFPAEQAADAHRLLEAGGVRGRIVLTF
jgi:NADPH:quinone reductase